VRQSRSNPDPQSTAVPQRPRLSARAILALLREQSVPELEARRRLNSDPRLRAELELARGDGRSG